MKTKDQILLEAHGDNNFNYQDIKRAMHLWGKEILISMLPRNLKAIYACLNTDSYFSAKELSHLTSFPSKSITTQLKQMNKNYPGLLDFKRAGKLFYWRSAL